MSELPIQRGGTAAQKLLSRVVQQTPSAVIITDREGRIVYVNAAFEEITGYTAGEAVGRTPGMLKSGETPLHVYRDMWWTVSAGHVWHGELVNRTKHGERLDVRAHIMPITDGDGQATYYAAVEEDITREKTQRERIHTLAYRDHLTDLANTALLKKRIAQSIEASALDGTHSAVVCVDLTDFKEINDALGHDTGDQILQQTARTLREMVGANDTVARLGGHEFVILLSAIHRQAVATSLAERILARFDEAFVIGGRRLVLSANLGLAFYPRDADTAGDLLTCGEIALNWSRRAAGNGYRCFTAGMNAALVRRINIEAALHEAVANAEFRVCYQPIVRLSDNRPAGGEALVRWDSASLGRVRPDEFIEAAENNGTIVDIGRTVLQRATAACARWRAEIDPALRISVNVSPQQFLVPDFVATVTRALAAAGLPASALEIEVTETVLLHESATVNQTLTKLSNLGVRLALDDFGTGYACLSYLYDHPFHTLKIDKTFVQDSMTNATARKLVQASLRMAQELGLDVVAEGVETEEQRAFLRDLGCDYGQGFLFARPLPATDFPGDAGAGAVAAVDTDTG
ncbi:PAS domain S-box-containing protein/diguanylate cyclase (GGDEF) domain-containing protein [Limimonas halophila]|uniref:PAS domain S-box-containing protein/diguanylate cyclase (GGDEF) domain-containing protein n=1 Tax=Limimonas halophila TaxID=1082479 RepID=A0A1G7SAE7_9PROT|nr:GGDEF domain-containing phosphodiesterase [Limimonas halophila]SDG19429.1 PAS domain S-box-containing protein/diguanylate cyclase (GGDEF) domain-containing protein [Limimonas halophila]